MYFCMDVYNLCYEEQVLKELLYIINITQIMVFMREVNDSISWVQAKNSHFLLVGVYDGYIYGLIRN